MGWLFTQGLSKSDLIQKLIKTEENETRRWVTLTHSVRGNVLWSVVELTYKAEERSKRFIACHLLRSDKGYGWGYKAMEESMGPAYYSCPLKYLEMAPEANAAWREAVREHHRQRNKKVTVGQRVGLVNASIPWVIVTSVKPLLGVYNGQCFRVPRHMIGNVMEQHP